MEFLFSLTQAKRMLKAINDTEVIPHIPIGTRPIDQIVLSFINGIKIATEAGKTDQLPQEVIEFYNELPDELFNEVLDEDSVESEIDPEDAWMHSDDDDLFLNEEDPEPKPEPVAEVVLEPTSKPKVTPKAKPKANTQSKTTSLATPKRKTPAEQPKAKVKAGQSAELITPPSNVINGAAFYSFIDRIYLGYDITNCCIIVRDGIASCTAISEELTVMVAATTPLNGMFNMDIGDLRMFRKYLSKHKKDAITVLVDPNDERYLLLHTGKNNTTFKFKMADPDMLTGYDASKNDLTAEGIDKFVEKYEHSIPISQTAMKSVLDHIIITSTDIVRVVVDATGAISLNGGLKSEHQFSIDIGIINNYEEVATATYNQFAAINLRHVISVLDFKIDVLIHFQEGEDFVISNGTDFWDFADITVED